MDLTVALTSAGLAAGAGLAVRGNLRPMRTKTAVMVLLGATITFLSSVQGGERFVSKQGSDANNGGSRETAFLTIQKGVDALEPGDTLTVRPGEYFENIKLKEFGDLNRETLIRAEIPGTVVLRGDRDTDLDFAQVPGQRFVYVADCKTEVHSVHEADTLTNLVAAADALALEFGPGRFFYDARARKLYLSSSDFQAPERHRYKIGVVKDHGFHMFKCRRVVLDGLAASGYRTPVEREVLLLPVSGFLLHESRQCVVRRCTAFFNGSGITINSGTGSNIDRPGEGEANLVEDCRAYANRLDGIVAYNPSGETIRNCRSFLNQTYGARFYGGRAGDALCLMEDVIAWGNPGGDFWTKGRGLSGFFKEVVAERCVAFRGCMFANFQHGLIGGGGVRGGERPTTIELPDEHTEFHAFLDAHFADALNYDFRFQGTSSFRHGRQGGAHVGLHAYKPNVYYVNTNGNDAGNGLSMRAAWKTPARAAAKLKAGDTLYIAPGRYPGDLTMTARDVKIRGRGIEPVVLEGGLRLANCEDVSVERLEISGPLVAANSRDVGVTDCVFSGPSVRVAQVKELRMTHNLFAAPLDLRGCSQVMLCGNLYASSPVVLSDSVDTVLYSSYNSYPDETRCWEVGGKVLSLDELRPRHDGYSVIVAPELHKSEGATLVANEFQFSGRGPLSTAIGPYREWQPKDIDLVGPFARSNSKTGADIEWWSTLPVQVDLRWGNTPQCANRKRISQNAFYSYSLLGLQPGRKCYVEVVPVAVLPCADPARRFRLFRQETTPTEFTPGRSAAAPRTYFVAPDGDDARDGLSRQRAWKSLQSAANHVRPGDTVLLAGGTHSGTFYFRISGEPGKPITLKAVPGEKATIDGMVETLKAGLVLYGKHNYRLDSLYFNGYGGIEDNVAGAECGAVIARDSADLQISRCHFSGGWGRCLEVHDCNGLIVRNCVFMHSMEAVMIYHCPNLIIENNVFIAPLITHLHVYNNQGEHASVKRCIFGENTRHKVHISPLSVGGSMSHNCFYVRWSRYDRDLFNGMTLSEYHAAHGDTGSLVANPCMSGALGFRQGWQQIENHDFDGLFATNPDVVLSGIGLQAEEFRDFHFWKGWPYDREWAAKVKKRMAAAEALAKAGRDLEAVSAFTNLAHAMPMIDRLKTRVLDRAAQCAAGAKDYASAMDIAKSIPLAPFAIRRQMAILVEQREFAELIRSFSDQAIGGRPHLTWCCPETEGVMADGLYYRAIAHAETGDLKAAEVDMRTMVDKGGRLGYSPGPTVLAVAWKRLGDFYRTRLNDEGEALEAYCKALETKSNPEISGILDDATKSAAAILRKQGQNAKARKLEQGDR